MPDLTSLQLDRIYEITALYGDNEGFMDESSVNFAARYVGAFDDADNYDENFDRLVAVELLYRYQGRNQSPSAKAFAQQRIKQIRDDIRRGGTPAPTGSPPGTDPIARQDAAEAQRLADNLLNAVNDLSQRSTLARARIQQLVDGNAAKINTLEGEADANTTGLAALKAVVDAIRSVPDHQGHAAGEVLTILKTGGVDWSTIGEDQIEAAIVAYLDANPVEGVTAQQLAAAVKVARDALTLLINQEMTNRINAITQLMTRSDNGDGAARKTVDTEAEWNAAITAQGSSASALWLLVTTRLFSTISGSRRARLPGELYYVPPRGSVAVYLIDTTSTDEVNALINTAFDNGIPRWARTAPSNVVGENQVYPLAEVFAPGYDNDLVLGTNGAGRLSWVAKGGGGGGGGGDVTTAQLAAERALREAGDSWNKTIIGGSDAATANARLATFLAAQLNSDNSAVIEITADSAQSGGHSYVRGDLVVFPPRSNAGKIMGNVANAALAGFGFLSTQVKNVAELNAVADGQADDPHGEFVEVTADFTYTPQGIDYKAGDVLWLVPYMASRLGVRKLFNLGDSITPEQLKQIADNKAGVAAVNAMLDDQARQIGLLDIDPEPPTITYTPGGIAAALTRTVRLRVTNPEILTGDAWVEGRIDGQAVLARRKWTNATGSLPLVISEAVARQIGQSEALTVQLDFFNVEVGSGQGTIIKSVQREIGLAKLPYPLHQTVAANSAATAIDVDDGLTTDMPMTANTTLTLSGGEDGLYATVRAAQDATGSRALTFGGASVEISTAANAIDRILFQRRGMAWELVGVLKAGA